jgi:hypothetical protein
VCVCACVVCVCVCVCTHQLAHGVSSRLHRSAQLSCRTAAHTTCAGARRSTHLFVAAGRADDLAAVHVLQQLARHKPHSPGGRRHKGDLALLRRCNFLQANIGSHACVRVCACQTQRCMCECMCTAHTSNTVYVCVCVCVCLQGVVRWDTRCSCRASCGRRKRWDKLHCHRRLTSPDAKHPAHTHQACPACLGSSSAAPCPAARRQWAAGRPVVGAAGVCEHVACSSSIGQRRAAVGGMQCTSDMHAHTHTHTRDANVVFRHARTHARTHAQAHTHARTHAHTHTYTHTGTHTHTHLLLGVEHKVAGPGHHARQHCALLVRTALARTHDAHAPAVEGLAGLEACREVALCVWCVCVCGGGGGVARVGGGDCPFACTMQRTPPVAVAVTPHDALWCTHAQVSGAQRRAPPAAAAAAAAPSGRSCAPAGKGPPRGTAAQPARGARGGVCNACACAMHTASMVTAWCARGSTCVQPHGRRGCVARGALGAPSGPAPGTLPCRPAVAAAQAQPAHSTALTSTSPFLRRAGSSCGRMRASGGSAVTASLRRPAAVAASVAWCVRPPMRCAS